MSVVMSQVSHRKCWKREFARGTWSSGKWFLQGSLPIPFFSNVSNNFIFFSKHLLSDLWGMLKTLKSYWSRAGLRHPDTWGLFEHGVFKLWNLVDYLNLHALSDKRSHICVNRYYAHGWSWVDFRRCGAITAGFVCIPELSVLV